VPLAPRKKNGGGGGKIFVFAPPPTGCCPHPPEHGRSTRREVERGACRRPSAGNGRSAQERLVQLAAVCDLRHRGVCSFSYKKRTKPSCFFASCHLGKILELRGGFRRFAGGRGSGPPAGGALSASAGQDGHPDGARQERRRPRRTERAAIAIDEGNEGWAVGVFIFGSWEDAPTGPAVHGKRPPNESALDRPRSSA